MRYRQLLLSIVVPALICACSAARAADLGPLPGGWFVAGPKNVSNVASGDYTIGLDSATLYNGQHSLYIGSKGSVTVGTFGTFMQSISAKNYLGHRVKFSAAVKTKDAAYAGLWMRVDSSLGAVRFDNMQNRPIRGTSDWKVYDVVLDVPENAVSISFGLLDSGTGEAWMADVAFGKTSGTTPTTDTLAPSSLPDQPQNLEF